MAMRKPGVYVALSANYADDEAIMEAGEDAELLYIRMLAYAARTPMTEGWISDRVILSRLGILPRVAGNGAGTEPGTDAGARAAKLAQVGLIHRDGDGYRITSWLKWNRSVEEMGRERARDANRKTSNNDGTDAGNDAGTGAGLPDASPLSDQITDTDQNQITHVPAQRDATTPSRRKPELPLPASWEPTDKHREFATQHGINLDVQATRFRLHAETNDRRARNWDAAFRTWLDKAKPVATVTPINHNQWMLR